MKVPFFDYPKLYLQDKSDFDRIFDDVGSRGAFIMQKDLALFESSLANFTNSKYAIGVANGTDGLELGLLSLNLKKGDEVIISSHTMIATASAIVTAGGIPVPVDIGEDNLIDASAIENAITSRTVGVMPTQLNGRTCNMDAILSIVNKYGLFLAEDAAQALGSRFKGKHAGTFGKISAISFFPAKVLGCLGDAGGVLTSDEELYHKIYQLHDHGRDTDGQIKSWGRNSRMDNLQAAILDFKLKTYERVIFRRREIASIYCELLSDIDDLKLPPKPVENSDHFDVFQNFELTATNRDGLKEFLSSKGIGTLIQWGGKAVHQWECFNFDVHLPATDDFFTKCIMLPMNVFLTNDQVEYVCESVREFYQG